MKVKCIDTDNKLYLTKDKVYEVISNNKEWLTIKCDNLDFNTYSRHLFKEVKEVKTMTKNFKEVIADIKEGEVWESRGAWIIKTVKMEKDNLFIDSEKGEELSINRNTKFQLQRKKVSFTEAFKAYEEGKEIESCVNGNKFKRILENGAYSNIILYKSLDDYQYNSKFLIGDIMGEWYINA